MRKIFCLLAIYMVTLSFGQSVTVKNIFNVNSREQGTFYRPQFSAEGQHIIATKDNFKGLYLLNINEKGVRQISDKAGAGYEPLLNRESNTLYFRPYELQKGRKFYDLITYDLHNMKTSILSKGVRDLIVLNAPYNSLPLVMENNNLKNLSTNNAEKVENGKPAIGVYIENRKIIVIRDGVKNSLEPLGEGIYIWPALSPDGTKFLFTKGGKGTYISDLEGNILQEIGYANAAKWSGDGNWLVYMKDYDDGTNYIASDIYLFSLANNREYPITRTDTIIEMYPNWNDTMTQIVYETPEGIVKIAEIEIK